MDFSPSALLSQIRSEDEDDFHIFSGIDDPLPETDNHPYQYHQHNAFNDEDDHEFVASTDQIMKAMMEDNLEISPQVFEGGVDQMASKISAAASSSATAAASSMTTVSSTSSDFLNCNYDLMPSPTSFDFISMFLEEETAPPTIDNTGAGKLAVTNKKSRSISRNKRQIKAHILNERKRREKLGQLFIKLAAIVPGLKKTDKGSIIVGATDNLKQLKIREASLRNEVKKIKKKSYKGHLSANSKEGKIQTSSDLEISRLCLSTISPSNVNSILVLDVDVKYQGRKILIRINKESQKNLVIANLLNDIEKINLKVTNCYWFPSEDSYLVVSIVAKMDAQFSLSAKELVTKLHALISHQ